MIEQNQTLISEQTRVLDAAVPRISGNWLRVARVAWLLLAIVGLAIVVTSLPGYAQRFDGQIDHVAAADQSTWAVILSGLSGLASLASAGLSFALAAVFFRQRFSEPMVAALSFFLLSYGIVMAGPLEHWSAYWLNDDTLALRLQGLLITTPSVALFAMFPDGRFVPNWTRWLIGLTVIWSVVYSFVPASELMTLRGSVMAIVVVLAVGMIGLFAAGLYAQVYRYRHVSSSAERQQAKWVMYGFTIWLGYILLSSIPYFYLINLPADAPVPWWASVSVLGWFLALNIVPISLTIAITRSRLWDIDLVINRTLVYGALTALVIMIYALVVGGMGALFQAQGNWLITLIATGLVAVLFQPLRERLQHGVNRLLYGHRDEPFEVLARLGERLEGTFAPELVLPTMVETIALTLKLPYVAIAVQQGETLHIVESYGKPTASPIAFPLAYQGDIFGRLLVANRSPDEAFTVEEERLLQDIARQAGTAIHALRLTADLQHARQQIVTSREEERRRLRRDLHDGLGPSLAAQLLKIGSARALLADQPEMTDKLLAEMETDTENTLADVRRIVYDLRPPALDQWGLAGALRAYAEACESGEVGEAQALTVRVEAPETLPSLPAAVEVAAYHIGREGLTNVVRHAQAQHCALRLAVDEGPNGRIRLSIQDDGRGFEDNVPAGVGLAAMRERAAELGGQCAIESRPGLGTRVTAVLPLES